MSAEAKIPQIAKLECGRPVAVTETDYDTDTY